MPEALKKEIEELDYRITGVTGISLTASRGSGSQEDKELHRLKLMSKKDALEAKGISNYHTFIKRFFLNGGDPLVFTEKLCRRSVEVVIMDEIGCGIVPIDRNDRAIREAVGRCGCIIAENSHTVVRVCCGIPTIIKGAENDHQPYTSR